MESTCNENFVISDSYMNFVWTSKIRCLSKKNFHTSDMFIWICLEEYAQSMERY